MNSQYELFEAKAARDQALTQVSENAADWMTVAFNLLLRIEGGIDLTGEMVRNRLLWMGCPQPHHHNAWGALIRTAVVRGALTDTGRMAHMENVRSHARRTPVYQRRPR